MNAGAVPVEVYEALPQISEEHEQSIGSIPANFFDQPQLSGDQQVSFVPKEHYRLTKIEQIFA